MEEKIIYGNLEYKLNHHRKLIPNDRDKESNLNVLVFEKIIELINKNKSYMLGPEKTSAARFISKHYIDVYKLLKEVIKKENNEY